MGEYHAKELVELIEAALVAELERQADYFVEKLDENEVPVPHVYSVDTSRLNTLEIATEVQRALLLPLGQNLLSRLNK